MASISPTSVVAGAAATTVTVTGTGFTSATVVEFGSTVENTAYVSSTQVTATLPAQQLTQGVLLPVIALNGDSSSGAGTAVDFTVNNPLPAITQLLPASLATGSPATIVAVSGTGFVPTSVIDIGGTARTTTFVSATQLNVSLTTADLAAAGSLSITAVNPVPGGGTSSAASLAVNNPVPGTISLTPSTLPTGVSTATSVAVTGSNFLSTSVVQINGSSRVTTVTSSTQLTFQLTVADQATAASLTVTVANPAPGGGASPGAILTLAAPTPVPTITQLYPSQFIAGSSDSTIDVTGTNLTQNQTVEWNGSALVTTYQNGVYFPYLSATVPAKLLATAGTASVTISSPLSNPTTSAPVTVTIANPPAPTLASLSPTSGPINTATTLTLIGTGFTSASTVALNGTNVTTTFVSSTQLTVNLPASSIALPGNSSFTVTTPAPGGGTSASLVYTAYIGIVNNSVVYNPVNGLFYASVPSSAGTPYGNSIVSIDPETGALGTPIPVGSEPNKLAISSDGTILWVGIDGAAAIRQVNLTTNTAGLQFGIGGNTGIYAPPPTALALAALPGAPNSVVVSFSTNGYQGIHVGIFDSGVYRGTPPTTFTAYNAANALLVDGSRSEIYAGSSGSYSTYTYNSSGISPLATSTTTANYASYSSDEMQIAGGKLYTDFGQVFDPESGSLLGSFYLTGNTLATGPTVADATLGKAFILDSTLGSYAQSFNQIQVFDTSNFTQSGSSVIPVSGGFSVGGTGNLYPSRLTRWGTNGLAFRTEAGLYSLRSNLVKDLSTTSADLAVTLAASGATTTGANTIYTATVTNNGPAASTNIALTVALPATGILASITPAVGTCSSATGISCDLGGLASGASTTVTITVQENTSGNSTLTAQVSGSETDPNAANNLASSTVAITGSTYNLQPTLTAVSPAAIQVGSSDTTITVTGLGFAQNSTVNLAGTALSTSFTNATTLTATVPAAQLKNTGWAALTVSSPTPGGGTSTALPLSVFNVITLGVNHIVYEPYSGNLMASVGSGSSSIVGNSVVAIAPATGATGTPVNIGSQPTNISLTSDSNFLYTVLAGSASVARFNMTTQKPDVTFSLPASEYGIFAAQPRWIAAQPGTDTTVAVDLGEDAGNAIFDVDPTAGTGTIRGTASGSYTGSCLAFTDAADLFSFDIDTTGSTLDHYVVTPSGFAPGNSYGSNYESTLDSFGCFKLSGGTAFSVNGGVANPTPDPAVQIGTFALPNRYYFGNNLGNVAPDASLQQTFFAVSSTSNGIDSIEGFNNNTFVATNQVPLPFATIEGSTSFSIVDLVRWGQDGIAVLTSSGHLYFVNGAAIVPGELVANSAATLTSSSASAITHATGNTLLTLTGSNFLPGVAVQWNGSYRTTTIIDATHVTVAIPASDLATAGTATLTAVNPGASASAGLTITIN